MFIILKDHRGGEIYLDPERIESISALKTGAHAHRSTIKMCSGAEHIVLEQPRDVIGLAPSAQSQE